MWYAKADTEYRLKKIDDAVISYRKVVELDPQNREARFDLAETLFDLEMYDEALPHFQELMHGQDEIGDEARSYVKLITMLRSGAAGRKRNEELPSGAEPFN